MTLEEWVAQLPDTEQGIVDYLTKKGIKGLKEKACECPLARDATQMCGFKVAVCGTFVGGVPAYPPGIMLPKHVTKFVRSFDAGYYYDLQGVE